MVALKIRLRASTKEGPRSFGGLFRVSLYVNSTWSEHKYLQYQMNEALVLQALLVKPLLCRVLVVGVEVRWKFAVV